MPTVLFVFRKEDYKFKVISLLQRDCTTFVGDKTLSRAVTHSAIT